MPGAPSSFLFLVVRPGATSSVLTSQKLSDRNFRNWDLWRRRPEEKELREIYGAEL